MLTVIVTMKVRYICSANSYCGNNGGGLYAVLTVSVAIRGGIYAVLAVIMTTTVRYIGSGNSYCDNNDNIGEVYM